MSCQSILFSSTASWSGTNVNNCLSVKWKKHKCFHSNCDCVMWYMLNFVMPVCMMSLWSVSLSKIQRIQSSVSLTVLVYHLLISEKCKYIRTSWQLHISKKKYFDERLLWLRNRTSFVLYLKVFSISENWSTIELDLHNYVFIS